MSQEKAKREAKKEPKPGRDERGRFTKEGLCAEQKKFQKENLAACKYREEYADMLIEYFNCSDTKTVYERVISKGGVERVEKEVPNDFPTFEAFAFRIGVVNDTLRNWCDLSPRFRFAYVRAKEMQKSKLLNNTLLGRYNPQFAKFVAINDHKMVDRVVTDNNVTSFGVEMIDKVGEEGE